MRTPFKALLFGGLLGTIGLGGCKPPIPIGIKMVPTPRTVVSLSPDAAELLSLGTPRLVGRSAADNYPSSVLGAPVVANIKPDYEAIASLKPDIIVYDPALYNAQDIEKLKALKIPLATIEGDTVDAYIKSIYKLGQATQSETSFMDYIDRLDKVVSVCRSEPMTPAPKTAIVMPSPNSNPMIAGTNSFYADLVRIAGGDPVGPATNKFERINAEALLALNPDAIIVPAVKGHENDLIADPRFAQLKAVKAGKVRVMQQDYILRRGERADMALKSLHAAMIDLAKTKNGS